MLLPVMRRLALFAVLAAAFLATAGSAQARSLNATLAAAMRGAGHHAVAVICHL